MESGMDWYITGGAVRDLLLGRQVRDLDVAFAASEAQFIQRNPAARKVSRNSHPVYILDGVEHSPVFGKDIREDLLRRDFTINALALDAHGVLYAHPQALADLSAGLIRPASPAALDNDPVRILRAARMAATLPGFHLTSETVQAMRAVSRDGREAVPAEQAGKETVKACLAGRPGNFLRVLDEGESLSPWFAELEGAGKIPAGPASHHSLSVLGHTAEVMDLAAGVAAREGFSDQERLMTVWMALCHDLGKAATPKELLPRHHGHEHRGEEAVQALGKRLALSNKLIKAGSLAAGLHMKAAQYTDLRSGTRVDLLMALHGQDLLKPFFFMVEADSSQRGLYTLAERELRIILEVSLPEAWRNQGELSGIRLRELRGQALASRRLFNPWQA